MLRKRWRDATIWAILNQSPWWVVAEEEGAVSFQAVMQKFQICFCFFQPHLCPLIWRSCKCLFLSPFQWLFPGYFISSWFFSFPPKHLVTMAKLNYWSQLWLWFRKRKRNHSKQNKVLIPSPKISFSLRQDFCGSSSASPREDFRQTSVRRDVL